MVCINSQRSLCIKSFTKNTSMNYRKSIPTIVFSFLPVIIYLVYTVSNSASLFFADDFHLLKTVLWIQDVDGIFEKLAVLMKQHNEHRILFPRLLTLLDYKLEGAINWSILILIGNLLWIANIWFFWEGFKSFKIPSWMFVAIPFIFLQPQYTDNVTWSISILQQSVIVFWFSLLTYLCSKSKFSWALLVAVIATFTHGNGIFSFFIGIIIAISERKWRTTIIWAGTWIIVGVIYFWKFQKGQAADFGQSLADPVRLVMAFFAFFGSVIKIRTENTNYAVLLGAILVLVLAVYLIPRLKSVFTKSADGLTSFDKMLLGNVLFLGITAALICVSRSWGGVGNVLAPRYQHYSPYLICWVYIVVLSYLGIRNRKIVAALSIGVAVTFNALSYFTYNEEVQLRKNWLVADESNWINHSIMLNYVKQFNDNIRETYDRVTNKGICEPQNQLPDASRFNSAGSKKVKLDFSRNVINDMDASGIYPHQQQRIANNDLRGVTFIYLSMGSGLGYWLPTRISHAGIKEFLESGKLSKAGFSIEFLTENFPAGVYKIGLLNNNKFLWTGEVMRID